jgi:hypothetical protein
MRRQSSHENKHGKLPERRYEISLAMLKVVGPVSGTQDLVRWLFESLVDDSRRQWLLCACAYA